MAATKFHADYDELAQIAQRFGREAEAAQRMVDSLRSALQTLEAGDWQGQGARAFYTEMNSAVLPSLNRMVKALASAQRVTGQVSREVKAGEDAAAAVLKHIGNEGGVGVSKGNGTSSATEAGAAQQGFSTLAWALGKSGGLAWNIFKERYAIQSIMAALKGHGLSGVVRFVKDANGLWRVLGSQAAKEALGLPKNLTRFGQGYLDKNIAAAGTGLKNVWGAGRSIVVSEGPFATRAQDALKTIRTPSLSAATPFAQQFKGGAIVSALVSTGLNVWDYGFGKNKETGLLSRQFLTSTTADVSAGVGIVGVSTAIGSLIPIPGVGTAVGFAAGLGLNYAYERWGKDAWRGAIDDAGKWLQTNAPKVTENLYGYGRDMARGAMDVADAIGNRVGGYTSKLSHSFGKVGTVLGF